MKYKIGQKVCYIGPDYSNDPVVVALKLKSLTPNEVYTIRGGTYMMGGIVPAYVVEEVVNPAVQTHLDGLAEPHTLEQHLRPLEKRKQDVSFTVGADPESENHDNRRKVEEHV